MKQLKREALGQFLITIISIMIVFISISIRENAFLGFWEYVNSDIALAFATSGLSLVFSRWVNDNYDNIIFFIIFLFFSTMIYGFAIFNINRIVKFFIFIEFIIYLANVIITFILIPKKNNKDNNVNTNMDYIGYLNKE